MREVWSRKLLGLSIFLSYLFGIKNNQYDCVSLACVLVLWGYYTKIPWPGWLVNNKLQFLTVLEAGNLRWGYQHGLVLLRALFLACILLSSPFPPLGERRVGGQRTRTLVSLLILMTLPNTNSSPKVLQPKYQHIGVQGFDIYIEKHKCSKHNNNIF